MTNASPLHLPTHALPDWDTAADAVINVGRHSYQRGWLPATSGNLSVRAAHNVLAITRTGVDKGALCRDDLLRQPVGAPLVAQSSAEAALHLRLYADHPEIGAVFHVHNLHAVVQGRLAADAGEIVLHGWELQKALSGVTSHATRVILPVFPNRQDIAQLANDVADRLAQTVSNAPPETVRAPGYVLAGHGLYAWGRDAAQAWRHLEALDSLLAQVTAYASAR